MPRSRSGRWRELSRRKADGLKKPPPQGPVAVAPECTVTAWFELFARHRESRGLTSVEDDCGRYTHHAKPVLGTLG